MKSSGSNTLATTGKPNYPNSKSKYLFTDFQIIFLGEIMFVGVNLNLFKANNQGLIAFLGIFLLSYFLLFIVFFHRFF